MYRSASHCRVLLCNRSALNHRHFFPVCGRIEETVWGWAEVALFLPTFLRLFYSVVKIFILVFENVIYFLMMSTLNVVPLLTPLWSTPIYCVVGLPGTTPLKKALSIPHSLQRPAEGRLEHSVAERRVLSRLKDAALLQSSHLWLLLPSASFHVVLSFGDGVRSELPRFCGRASSVT